jgi:hypothetical protein
MVLLQQKERVMSSGQILQSVGYLLWAAGFAVLILCLGAATIRYRRFNGHQDSQ